VTVVSYAYARKFTVQLLYVRPVLHKTCLFMSRLTNSVFFEGGQFRRILEKEGGITHQPVWCHKTRVTAILCGIKICTMHHLVLSQYTHPFASDL